MTANLFCTYFDSNYLNRALSLFESLDRANNGNYAIVAVCVDELARLALEKLAIPQVTTIPLHEIEYLDAQLLACKEDRTATEYMWTLTPSVIRHVYRRFPDAQCVTYVDADLYFWQPQEAILTELGNKDVLIHRHNFSQRLQHLDAHGTYNVGLLCFSRSETSEQVLFWWRERCIEWCYKVVEDGKFGDQGYLDYWPIKFDGVKVSEHPGIGVAPWNHELFDFSTAADGTPQINGQPIVFFHYHGIRLISEGVILPCDQFIYEITPQVYRHAYLPYLHSLMRSHEKIERVHGQARLGYERHEHNLKTEESFLIHSAVAEQFWALPVSHQQIPLDESWSIALSPYMSTNAESLRPENVV